MALDRQLAHRNKKCAKSKCKMQLKIDRINGYNDDDNELLKVVVDWGGCVFLQGTFAFPCHVIQ